MTTDWKALCAELLAWAEKTSSHYYIQADVLLRARAALAEQPAVPDGREPASFTGRFTFPADGEVAELVAWLRGTRAARLTRAADLLQRQAAPVPVPVSERWPKPEDCDAGGRCWWWHPSHAESGYSEGWMRRPRDWGVGHYDLDDRLTHSHWLPFHALPLPELEGAND